MAFMRLNNVTVEFPIYSIGMRSLKHRMMNLGSGGRMSRDAAQRLTVTAVRNVSAEFNHGDRVALVGRNGAGKTTLLRVLAGVYEPSFGDVTTQGQVATLFDVSLGLDTEATGYENIHRQGTLLGLSARKIAERTEEIAAFTELGDYLRVPVRTYSSGMVLRLAFAISTSVEPEILLMDEWIGVGDARFIEKAEQRMQALVSKAGIMAIASHSADLVRRVCNKALYMEKGEVVAAGPVDEVLAAYAKSGA